MQKVQTFWDVIGTERIPWRELSFAHPVCVDFLKNEAPQWMVEIIPFGGFMIWSMEDVLGESVVNCHPMSPLSETDNISSI